MSKKKPLEGLLFAIAVNIDSEQPQIVFTPKAYWQSDGCCYDQHLGAAIERALGDRFRCMQESTYAFNGTVGEARALLTQTLNVEHSPELEQYCCDHDCNPATDDMDLRNSDFLVWDDADEDESEDTD